MTSRYLKSFLAVSLFSLCLYACTQVDVSGLDPDIFTNAGNGGGGTTTLCDNVEFAFSENVLPIFDAKCNDSGCHGSGSAGGGLNLDQSDDEQGDGESGVIGEIKGEGNINAFSAAQSNLLLKPLATAEGGAGNHTGGEIFPNTVDPDYKTLFCWIDDGAKNDLDDSECTFGEHVYPIFRQRGCTAGACHDAASPGGDLNLAQGSLSLLAGGSNGFPDNTGVVVAGDNTSLLLTKPSQTNSVTHDGGTVFDGTTDEDYKTIKCWIQEGAQNN